MQLSDVFLAETVAPLEFVSLASYDEPYLIGPFHVVPRVNSIYRQGDSVSLFYEVYGGEGNLIRHAPLLRNALSILPAPLWREADVPAPRHSLSHQVHARLRGDRTVAISQGGRPGKGFVAHR